MGPACLAPPYAWVMELVDMGDSKSPSFGSVGSIPILGTIYKKYTMFKKVKDIKQKIKFAKIGAIIFWIVFLLLIINSIYLTVKVYKLENQISKTDITITKGTTSHWIK